MVHKAIQTMGTIACAWVLFLGAQQAAGTVRVDLLSTIESPILNQKVIHPTFAEIGPTTSSTSSVNFGEAHAIANGLAADSLLKVKATSTITSSFVRTIAAHATWEDTLLVTGTGTAPSDIQLTFTIDGQLSIDITAASTSSVSRAVLNIVTENHLGVFEPLGNELRTAPPAIANGYLVRVEQISQSGSSPTLNVDAVAGIERAWLSTPSLIETSPGVYDFTGTIGITTPFDASTGGYNAALSLTALASGRNATSSSDFLNTAKLTSVTLPDGSPLPAGFDFNFDSGLTFIPEPSSMTLLLASSLLLLKRRQRTTCVV